MALLILLGHTAFALDVPKLEARVTDLAGVFSEEQVRALEAKLQELESKDSTQVAVLVIPTLEEEQLEEYSHRVASAWKLGQKGRDNGALVLIAMKERKIRIEVGYGLEPTLTDARSRRIIQNNMVPHFKTGDFYSGIEAGITGIIQVVRGTYQAEPSRPRSNRSGGRRSFDWIIFLFIPFLWVLGAAGKWGGGILGAGCRSHRDEHGYGDGMVWLAAGRADWSGRRRFSRRCCARRQEGARPPAMGWSDRPMVPGLRGFGRFRRFFRRRVFGRRRILGRWREFWRRWIFGKLVGS